MACWEEEIFGPVAAIMRFKEEAEAISIANNTDRGLAAYFFSRSVVFNTSFIIQDISFI